MIITSYYLYYTITIHNFEFDIIKEQESKLILNKVLLCSYWSSSKERLQITLPCWSEIPTQVY